MPLDPTIKSPGTTLSERQLSDICENTFLNLWSYPNLFTDEGLSKNKQGKELCDLVSIFGRDIFLFSDKSISFSEKEINVAWPRWYRKAILSSSRQILGAEKWILEHGHRIYLDSRCQRPFPIPSAYARPRFHRIVVARNSKGAAEKHFGGGSSGSLIIRPDIVGEQHFEHPFHIGTVIPGRPYIHVLDHVTLQLILRQLDTVPDLANYLTVKERAITAGQIAIAAGEEEVLAFYLSSREGVKPSSRLIPSTLQRRSNGPLMLVEGLWEEYSSSDQYLEEKHFLEVSYLWDELLQRAGQHILIGDAIGSHKVADHEQVLRMFAAETRRGRAILSYHLREKYLQVPPNMRSARVIPSPSTPDKAYILLFFPRSLGQGYEDYRGERQGAAVMYAQTLKLMSPVFRYICVIATEPQKSAGRSEDFMAFDIPRLSNAEKDVIRAAQREFEIFTDLLTPFPKKGTTSTPRPGATDRRPQRNELCRCGSGVKFKRCCGR